MTAVLQTRVFVNQLSATVWPYLSFTITENDTLVRYTVENDGLGPAILRSAVLTVDGKRRVAMRDISAALANPQPHRSTLSSASLDAGEVLRPGVTARVFEYHGPGARKLADILRKRVTLSVCYCSLLDQCWIATSLSGASQPTVVKTCPSEPGISA